MSPASLSGRLFKKQAVGSNPPPRCSGVLKLLRSIFRCLKYALACIKRGFCSGTIVSFM